MQLFFSQVGFILLYSETRQPVIVNVDAPGIIRRNKNVNAHIKLESINKKRVVDVSADYTAFINRNFRDVIDLHKSHAEFQTYDVDAFALAGVLRFDDPLVGLITTLDAVEMAIEVSKLVWQNVTVWNYAEFFLSKLLLELYDICN